MTEGSDVMATPEPLKVVPLRHPGRWAAMAVIAVLLAMLVHALATNPRFNWPEQAKYGFTPAIRQGVLTTLWLTVAAMVVGVVLGVVLAVMRLSPNPVLRNAAWIYIWVFRGTPVLVQILVWASLGALFPRLGLGIPFGPQFVEADTFSLISGFSAALLGLGLNEAAYMAEIVRAGLLSVNEGQWEAAGALGMRRSQILRRVVLPQAMRVIVPPTGNETISMLKTTSLVAYVPFAELLFQTQAIYAKTYQVIPMLLMASLWYLAMTSVLMIVQYYIERYYARGSVRQLPPTPWQRVRARLERRRPRVGEHS
ncbi:MAG TPA: ABC transporter permease [Actinobacteria bacterium]|mgnify:CR=1 FL=1|nr:ABC transporter permease [Actinomycetota bacterium]HCK79720.1 ABC transporter permease [Actinomycetota bacterium]